MPEPRKKRKSTAEKLLGPALEYGIPTAAGAGIGFLLGGPPGAAIGATTALGTSIAGPRAAKALPEGTPKALRTATEFGIYGLGTGALAGAGARAGAKVALRGLLTQATAKESAKLAGQIGAGAVVGESVADIVGVPDTLGAILGSVAAPFSPGIARGVRGNLYNSAGTRQKALATALGATEANSLRKSRSTVEVIQGRKLLGSVEDEVRRRRGLADHLEEIKRRKSPDIDEAEVLAITGGYSEPHIRARRSGQLPPDMRQVVTPELTKAHRRLASLNKRYASARATEETTDAAIAELTSTMPTPEGELSYSERFKSYLWREPNGIEHPVPDEIAQPYKTAQTAREAAKLHRQKLEDNMKGLLGTEELPQDFEGQLGALRNKIVGPEGTATLDQTLLDPMEARRMEQTLRGARREHQVAYGNAIANLDADAKRQRGLADFLEANPDLGVPAPGEGTRAAINLSKVQASENLFEQVSKTKHKYLDMPREKFHTFADYLRHVNFVAGAQPNADRAQAIRKSMLGIKEVGDIDEAASGLRGSVWLATPDGEGLEPRYLVDIFESPDGDISKGTALVRSEFQSAENADEVPLDLLRVRYSLDKLTEFANEVGEASKGYIGMPHPRTGLPMSAADVRTFRRRLPQAQPLVSERYWATRKDYEDAVDRALKASKPPPDPGRIIEEDLASAWEQFRASFVPAEMTIEGNAFTPEFQEKKARGAFNVMSRGPRAGSTRQERQTFYEFQRKWRQDKATLEGEYLSTGDQELLELLKVLPDTDPKLSVILMAEQSTSDVQKIVSSDMTRFGGALGQFIERHGAGIIVRHPQMKAVLQNYLGSVEQAANYTAGTYQPLRVAMAQTAARLLDKPKGSVRQGLKAAAKALPRPGRAVHAFTNEVHPLSKETELYELMRREFKPENLANSLDPKAARLGNQFNALDDADKAIVTDWLTTQARTFVDYPEAFPVLTNNKEFQAYRNAWRMYDAQLTGEMHIMHASAQTKARRMSMLVDRGVRGNLNYDRVNAGNATLLDLYDEVKYAITRSPGGSLEKVSQALVRGADADMAWAMAGRESMAIQQVVEKIKGLARPGQVIGSHDLIFSKGSWDIQSKNKWPAEIEESLKGMIEIVSGKHQWGGLQQLSQQIAMGNLAGDMSILGIQGFKYMAQAVMSGHPVKAAQVISRGLTTIMTDVGFYSWLRQDLDELMYYSSLGLTGGLKGYIAGPTVNKLPLEHLPYVGGAFGAMRQVNDLQFNRALYYWKVEAIRNNLEVARWLRQARGHVADKFLADVVDSSPSLKAQAAEMGGLENYLLATNEDTVKSVIRQVNRSLGGVSLDAEGVGATRQAVEQIVMIVPGFFRAQAGQWAAVVTKPHTLEGHLALSMLAREYLFGASVATGFARMMGTEDQINWDNPNAPTWLGIPVPGGGTISTMPTMGLPRLASRIIRETVQGATGEGADYDRVLESFAHGRLSPLVGTFYDNFKNEDFLGRKYDSVYEKWGNTFASLTMPIVAQSALEDVTEAVKQGQATGNAHWAEAALSVGVEAMGKGLIPQHPSDRLNNIAQDIYGTDWGLLTDTEKVELRRANPAAVAAEAEYDFYSRRRAGTRETHVDAAYKQYQKDVDAVWNEPKPIDGLVTSQNDDDALLMQGQMTGETWRERYHVRQAAVSQWYEALRRRLETEGVDPDEIREEKIQRMVEQRRPEDVALLLQLARTEYTAVKPPTEERIVSTPAGAVTVETVNWDEFFDDREAVLNKYPAEIRDVIRRGAKADELPGLARYREAAQAQREIESLGRYRGLTAAQGEKIDQMRSVISSVGEAIRGQAGATSVPSATVQQLAMQEIQRQGLLASREDTALLAMAVAMTKNEKLADSMVNPAQIAAIVNNPDAIIYYPYLRWRVPKALWPSLPQQIFSAELAEEQLTGGI